MGDQGVPSWPSGMVKVIKPNPVECLTDDLYLKILIKSGINNIKNKPFRGTSGGKCIFLKSLVSFIAQV